MTFKGKIKKILKEYDSSSDSETRKMSTQNRNQLKFAKAILKEKHREIVKHNKYRREDNENFDGGYPDDFDEFILSLKDGFPNYDGFGHALNITMNSSNHMDGMDPLVVMKLLSEYVLNYGGDETNERVDIVPENKIHEYIEKQYFECTDKFFNSVWEDLLGFHTDFLGEDIKGRMWDEIAGEVEEKMENEDWQEEHGIQFDRIEYEEDYFKTYWYYPIQNLGWDKQMLCEWYKYYLDSIDLTDFFFPNSDNQTSNNKIWSKYGMGYGTVYVIHRNKIFP